MLLAESVIVATTSPLLGTSVQREDTFLGLLSATNVAGRMNTTSWQIEDKQTYDNFFQIVPWAAMCNLEIVTGICVLFDLFRKVVRMFKGYFRVGKV